MSGKGLTYRLNNKHSMDASTAICHGRIRFFVDYTKSNKYWSI